MTTRLNSPEPRPLPELYVMNADGSGQTRLTFNVFFDGNPTWSSDSQRLAFQSRGDGDHEIYVINVDGSGLTKLTDNDDADVFPAWSPDGRFIAFSSNRPKTEFGKETSAAARREFRTVFTSVPTDFDIYIMEPDGSGIYNWDANNKLGRLRTFVVPRRHMDRLRGPTAQPLHAKRLGKRHLCDAVRGRRLDQYHRGKGAEPRREQRPHSLVARRQSSRLRNRTLWHTPHSSRADIQSLVEHTGRTFALTRPSSPLPTPTYGLDSYPRTRARGRSAALALATARRWK